MTTKNIITANKQNISDAKTKLSFRQDMLIDAIVEEVSELKSDFTRGVIISQQMMSPDANGNAFIMAEIRTELNDAKVSNANAESDFTPEEIKLLQANHTYAISKHKFPVSGDPLETSTSYVGVEVDVFFKDGAPSSRGKERGAEFVFVGENVMNPDLAFGLSGSAGGFADLFNSESKLVASTANPNEESKMPAGEKKGVFRCSDIDTSPFRNAGGQRMYAREPKTADSRGFDMRGRGENLIITTFLTALTSMLPFKILINSTFRT